jgi:signal transduction histidine kinase
VASQWRIRHKLMLGLVLVMGTIALLLGGTLRGLWSYYVTNDEIRVSLAELSKAEELRGAVAALSRPLDEVDEPGDEHTEEPLPARPIQSADRFFEVLLKRTGNAQAKLSEYEKKLDENAEHGSDPVHIEHQRKLAHNHLLSDLAVLKKKAEMKNSETASKTAEKGEKKNGDLDVRHNQGDGDEDRVRRPFADLIARIELTSDDLLDKIKNHLDKQTEQSRKHYQAALWVIVPASIVGLLSMAALMRSFYRWIFYPIRDLEAGVKRVAQGDFDHRIEVHSGDEMEDLAVAFADMTRRLRDLYADLARQVNERSRQLVRSERLASVGFLAAGVAHEINNPLASIAFCSEALEGRLADLLSVTRSSGRRSDDEEVFARYLRMIQEEAFRCKKITEKLLEFSRSSERRREPTDLAALVQSVIDITQHLQSCKGKQIVFEADRSTFRETITAPVNAEEIKSVVLNLVVNALDSMEEGGKLTIHLSLRDNMAEMRFMDTGCGMSQDVLENIFEPFFTRSRTGKGTGLGLTISHRIINQHGGEIEATSDGPNKGSTFVVRLPLTESEPRQAQPVGAGRERRAA